MTVGTITPQSIISPFAAVGAGLADFTWQAGTITDGDEFTCNARDVILVWNPAGGSAYTVTITSYADEKGRTKDITTYSMAAGDFAVFGCGLTNSPGWKSSAGKIKVTVSNAAVMLAVLRLPAGYP